MRVLAIDSGIVNVGVALVGAQGVERLSVERVAASERLTTAELAAHTGQWVRASAQAWGLETLDLVVVEAVQRAKIQAMGIAAIGAIKALACPNTRIVMKMGHTKFKIHPDLEADYNRLKGRPYYNQRKRLCTDFCMARLPQEALPEGSRGDWADAVLLAVAGIRQMRWEASCPWVQSFVTRDSQVSMLPSNKEGGQSLDDDE